MRLHLRSDYRQRLGPLGGTSGVYYLPGGRPGDMYHTGLATGSAIIPPLPRGKQSTAASQVLTLCVPLSRRFRLLVN